MTIKNLDKKIKARVINEGLHMYLNDNVNSWIMNHDGKYHVYHDGKKSFSAQQYLMSLWQNNAKDILS